MLPVLEGFIPRLLHNIKPPSHLSENRVDLLQRPIRCLRIEEIHHREDERIDDSQDDIYLISNGAEGYRYDHHNHDIENPVRRCREPIYRSANAEGNFFSGIEPSHS